MTSRNSKESTIRILRPSKIRLFGAGVLWVVLTAQCCFAGPSDAVRTWTSKAGKTVEARYLRTSGTLIVLESSSKKTLRIPLTQLSAEDQQFLASKQRGTTLGAPKKPLSASEMRKLKWEDLEAEDLQAAEYQPKHLTEGEMNALNMVVSSWRYAKTPHFVIHYQKKAFAQSLARQAEFFYHYVAQDLEGPEDRMGRRSHIFIFEDDQWQSFLNVSKGTSWAAAYVRGPNMFLYDSGNNKRNANLLAHEMTHLILNRFFKHQPANWMNEGLAEWYEEFGRALFKGTGKNIKSVFREDLRDYYSVDTLLAMRGYPEQDDIGAFYKTSKYILGYLRLEHDKEKFLNYLFDVVLEGKDSTQAMLEHYGFSDVAAFKAEFLKFAGRD